jgi:hypothetical protein
MEFFDWYSLFKKYKWTAEQFDEYEKWIEYLGLELQAPIGGAMSVGVHKVIYHGPTTPTDRWESEIDTSVRYKPLLAKGKRGGKWCGWGWYAEGRPLDIVDAVCRKHDIRYNRGEQKPDSRYWYLAADLQLVDDLFQLIRRKKVRQEDFDGVKSIIEGIAIPVKSGDWPWPLSALSVRPPITELKAKYFIRVKRYPLEPEDIEARRKQVLEDWELNKQLFRKELNAATGR